MRHFLIYLGLVLVVCGIVDGLLYLCHVSEYMRGLADGLIISTIYQYIYTKDS